MANRTKFDRVFGTGAFGLPDVPAKVGHKLRAGIEEGNPYPAGRTDGRSWKRRRKTRWRPK